MTRNVTAAEAAATYRALSDAGLTCWVVGGWGVDALLGRQTREHHDLDLLVTLSELPRLDTVLASLGFVRAYEWEENRPTPVADRLWDTAFVVRRGDGLELDLHAITIVDRRPVWEYDGDLDLPPGCLDAHGTIHQTSVRCASAPAQLTMHTGYALPDAHRRDVALLEAVAGPGVPPSTDRSAR